MITPATFNQVRQLLEDHTPNLLRKISTGVTNLVQYEVADFNRNFLQSLSSYIKDTTPGIIFTIPSGRFDFRFDEGFRFLAPFQGQEYELDFKPDDLMWIRDMAGNDLWNSLEPVQQSMNPTNSSCIVVKLKPGTDVTKLPYFISQNIRIIN